MHHLQMDICASNFRSTTTVNKREERKRKTKMEVEN